MDNFRKLIEQDEKRYIVTVSMYMYDKDDKAVKKQAEKLVKTLQRKDDNDAKVLEIVEQGFGTLGNRPLKI